MHAHPHAFKWRSRASRVDGSLRQGAAYAYHVEIGVVLVEIVGGEEQERGDVVGAVGGGSANHSELCAVWGEWGVESMSEGSEGRRSSATRGEWFATRRACIEAMCVKGGVDRVSLT